MKFVAEIDIMPHKELLDPQGKAVANNLKNLNIHDISDVRIGKHVTLTLEAETEEAAREIVDNACRKLLANLIMETFSFELSPQE
jgi:phosphoribosylformylglycinamidine synthase subunit PurS